MTRADTDAGMDADATGPGRAAGTADGTGGTRRAAVLRAVRGGLGPGPWRRGPVLAAAALALGSMMLFHGLIPNRVGGLGSLVESFLPWFGLFVPVLLAAALWRRSASAVVALVLPVAVWLHLFGGLLGGQALPGGDLTVVGHNVGADNADPVGTARDLAASGADVLALVELTGRAGGVYEEELADEYPYHAVLGTVGVWSRLPLSDTRPVDTAMDAGPLGEAKSDEVKMEYNRALRTTVATAEGPLEVYVAHLGSVRVTPRTGFWTESRDRNAQALAEAVAAEPGERVVLLGDLNGTVDDRALAGLTEHLSPVQEAAGDGFGFSWPAAFPVARIDHILVRGVEVEGSWVLPATGSDHLPVAAGLR